MRVSISKTQWTVKGEISTRVYPHLADRWSHFLEFIKKKKETEPPIKWKIRNKQLQEHEYKPVSVAYILFFILYIKCTVGIYCVLFQLDSSRHILGTPSTTST